MRNMRLMSLLVGALALGACDSNGDGTLLGNTRGNRLTVQLTDAPGDLKEVFVKIEKIVLVKSDADTTGSNRLEIKPKVTDWINLLSLSGGKLLDIADTAGLAAGTYSQMRVFIDDAYIKTTDNRVFATSGATLPSGVTSVGTLKCPSCSQSGYKVMFTNGGLTISPNSSVVIDFDAGQSFGHEAGKSGQWIMRPVLRATAKTTTAPAANGLIKGAVTLATGVTIPTCGGQANTVQQFKPFARLNADTLSASVDAAGAYRIANVNAGTWTLGYHRDVTYTNGDSLTFTATPTPATVTVAAQDSATANFSITAASCH